MRAFLGVFLLRDISLIIKNIPLSLPFSKIQPLTNIFFQTKER